MLVAMQLEDLPTDDSQLWLVKWIDEFRLPHLGTRSASVKVLCQRLDFQEEKNLSQLNPENVERIIGNKIEKGDDWCECRLLVGYLPYFSIGMVFKNGKHVGNLPCATATVTLANIESSNHDTAVSDAAPPPPEWNTDWPYRTINRSEFSGLLPHGFSRSRCVVHQENKVQYIIPRSVIFRCFYGQSSQIANAFCKGPWHETSNEIICYSELASGLITQRNDAENAWDIILRPKIKISHSRLLAAFTFDEYAQSCAASIYTNSLKDRGASALAPWYASAKIPFDTTREPLSLKVKGFYLKTFSTAPKKFLVTSIVSAPFPSYFPDIRYQKTQSGDQGDEIIKVDEPAPFQHATATTPAPADAVGFSDEDINIEEGSLAILATEDFIWSNARPIKKLVKPKSNQYKKHKIGSESTANNSNVSAGSSTYQGNGLTEALINTLIRRDRAKQFTQLLAIFDEFSHNGTIDRYSILQPIDRSMLMPHAGLPCWNFLSENARRTGKWPRRGWRLLETPPKGKDSAIGVPRSALVLEIAVSGRTGYWIEIEVRPGSTEGFRSPFIITDEDPHDAVAHFIEAIAELDGVKLKEKLPQEASYLVGTSVRCYKHRYESAESALLDKKSIAAFLNRGQTTPVPQ